MFLKFFSFFLIMYLIYAGIIFIFQRKLIYPVHNIIKPFFKTDTSIQKNVISFADQKAETWFLPAYSAKGEKTPLLFIAHGNACLIDHWQEMLEKPRKMGFSAFLVEYPGYGRSLGKPTQQNITTAFIKAFDVIKENPEIDKTKIIFIGRSLGSGVICSLAREHEPSALILISPFTSIKAFAHKFFLPEFLVLDPYDNLSFLKNFKGPLMVVHGKSDQVIPFSHSQELLRIRPDAFFIGYDTDHNETPPDWDIFWDNVYDFLKRKGVL